MCGVYGVEDFGENQEDNDEEEEFVDEVVLTVLLLGTHLSR